MAQTTHVAVFDRTLQTTHDWLEELEREGRFRDQEQALSALRAVVQTLRDRLTVEEAADLGAQLPTLIRGFYYERWKPAAQPKKLRSLDEFLQEITPLLNPGITVGPEAAARAVFALLSRRITRGEIEDVRHMLPKQVEALWPEG